MFSWVFATDIEERPGWDRPGDPSTEQRTTRFRSWRGGGRWHAACDLVVPLGTEIRAVCDGTVQEFSSFYEGTWELVVVHEHEGYEPFIARYGEVMAPASGGLARTVGERVSAGQVIARVGQLEGGGHMLHFELFAGTGRSPSLSMPRNRGSSTAPDDYTEAQREAISASHWHPYFQRRNDLCDPSRFLLGLKRGTAPPAPTPYQGGDAATAELEYMDFEDEHIFARRRRVAASPRGSRVPSWLETHLGIGHEEHADPSVVVPGWHRHGPEE